jgi:serine/threonine protein kinase
LQPQRIGKYELTKFLGGGMSHVYVARDTLIGRTVAVKILTDSGALDDATRARFIREAQLAGNIVHDNIIRVYDFGEESGRLFMVMELLEGEDLNDAIRHGRTGTIENKINISIQIAKAMEYIHALKIVHRDLKPHNVFMTRGGVAKLMDFGIAKTDETSVTKTGFALGTPSYMAPEQVLGKPVNHLSDIYSFGIMLFELVTDTKPLTGDSVERVFWRILNDPVDLTPLRTAGAPEPLADLVRRCTEKNPATRPQSFTEIRQELEAMLPGAVVAPAASRMPSPQGTTTQMAPAPAASPVPTGSTPAIDTRPAKAPSSKLTWIAAAAVAVVALLVGGYFVFRPKPQPTTPPSTEESKTTAKSVEAQPAPTLSLPAGDMVLVPAGPFLFGKNNETATTPAYYIDRTEVTNAAYGAFLKATNYRAPKDFDKARPEFPVVFVTIQDAREFARWAGKRLPTAVEWEKAARGIDGRIYPWGDNADPSLAAVVGGVAKLRPANTDSAASPYGAFEMEGNVWELIEGAVTPSDAAVNVMSRQLKKKVTAQQPWCTMRGGSFRLPLVPLYEFSSIPESLTGEDIGFRCARDVR